MGAVLSQRWITTPLVMERRLWGNLGAVNTIVEEEQIDWTA